MEKKGVIDRLEASRIAMKELKSFRGKMPTINQIRQRINFLSSYKADDLSDKFYKETLKEIMSLKTAHPDRAKDFDSVLSVLTGNEQGQLWPGVE